MAAPTHRLRPVSSNNRSYRSNRTYRKEAGQEGSHPVWGYQWGAYLRVMQLFPPHAIALAAPSINSYFSCHMHYNFFGLIRKILYYLYEKRLYGKSGKALTDSPRPYPRRQSKIRERDGIRSRGRPPGGCAQVGRCAPMVRRPRYPDRHDLGPFAREYQRNKEEVEALFKVIGDKMEDLSHNQVIAKNKFQVKAFGNLDMLPADVRRPSTGAKNRREPYAAYAQYRCRATGAGRRSSRRRKRRLRRRGRPP